MILESLSRTDKWFLGNGRGCLFAPPFPRWLDTLGFWDECWFADVRLDRLFCLLAAHGGREAPTEHERELDWRPDRLVTRGRAGEMEFEQRRFVHPANAFVTELDWRGEGELQLLQWSLPEVNAAGYGAPWRSATLVASDEGCLIYRLDTRWPTELEPDRTAVEREALTGTADMGPSVPVFVALGASVERDGYLVQIAQRHDDSPLWRTSVLPDLYDGALVPCVRTEGEGLLHLVQSYTVRAGDTVRLAAGVGLSADDARAALAAGLRPESLRETRLDWLRHFQGVPDFRCDDPYLEAAYRYRWYGIKLNTVSVPGLPRLGRPFVAEGIGFFRNCITYSGQAMLRETSWMRDPDLAIGILDNMAANQRPDGSLPGHIYSGRPARDFYHADFATPVRQLEAIHPGSVQPHHREMLRRYADYLWNVRYEPATGMTCVFDQNETGQEYMSRYQFVSDAADEWASFRVGGVDATVYAALLFDALGDDRAADAFRAIGECWDDGASFFCDRLPNGARSPARPGTGLYPLLLGARRVGPDRAARLIARWLANPEEFWLDAGFPATAQSNPTFASDGAWKGRRLNCPWNGRSWPMANSHLVDGLAETALGLAAQGRDEWLATAAEGIHKVVRLLFHESDPDRPCCYEHFNPVTGVPALYRGYDDYMHSWVADLILRRVVGLVPGSLDSQPLPMGVAFECSGIPCRGETLQAVGDSDRVDVVRHR